MFGSNDGKAMTLNDVGDYATYRVRCRQSPRVLAGAVVELALVSLPLVREVARVAVHVRVLRLGPFDSLPKPDEAVNIRQTASLFTISIIIICIRHNYN